MNVVTKSVDAAVESVESEHPNGEFEVILSTESTDRDDENLWADEWKQPLPARIHIDGDHGRSLEKTVGSAVPRIEGNRMVAKGTYAGTEYAQMVRQLVNEGHINSVSVTYAERKNQKNDGVQRELLNAAFVAIPANPEAVVLASKAAKLDHESQVRRTASDWFKDKDDSGVGASGNNPKHDDMVQAIHDAACHLGAMCLTDITADPGTADGANKSIKFEFDTYESIWFKNWDTAFKWLKVAVEQDKSTSIKVITKSSSPDGDGSPQETTEESTAATAKAAATAEESADDTAKASAAAAARARQFLMKKAGESHA